VKIITTGEGGMALTNDSRLAEKMSWFRTHGITNKSEFMQPRPADEIWNYQQIELGFNYRMTDIQAALGLSQFDRLEEFIQRRHDIAKRYYSSLSKSSFITPLQRPETFSSYHLYPIRIRKAKCGKSQDQILKSLHSVGIAANIHYIPVYRHPFFEKLGFAIGYCPEAEAHFREVVSLPMFSLLKDRDQDQVIHALAEALRQ
jgi:dTDP-4-amino-4,6-dideoxygalactose transaminase